MLNKLMKLFEKMGKPKDPFAKMKEEVRSLLGELDFDDPNVRVGVSLHSVLSKQFALIGKPEGEFPYIAPFASDKARGALLGISISIVRREFGEIKNKAVIDATITAFSLAFGTSQGAKYALDTIQEASDGNDGINSASDWAIEDTDGSIGEDSPATPAAYYLAVAGMI